MRASSPSASTSSARRPVGFIPQLDPGYLIIVTQLPPRRLARAHRCGQSAGRGHRAASAGRRARGQLRRLLRRDLHQRAERGRGLRRPRALRGARAAIRKKSARRDPGSAVAKLRGDPGRPGLRGDAAAGARHRQRRRLPHDGGGPRRRRAAGAAGRRLRHDGPRRADAGPRSRCSRCSRPRRRSSISTSTAPRRRCSASTCPTCSPRCRPISAPPTSTTSICSGRTFRVTAQADAAYRLDPKDVLKIRVRNSSGDTVPLGSFTTVQRHVRPLPRAALQSLSGRRARRRAGARLLAGPGHRDDGEARRRDAAAGLQLRVDRRSPSSSCGPATPRCSPSCWRWCSCSWCWPRSTRA